MNTLEIMSLPTSDGFENECFVIDGIPLHDYLTKWYLENGWGEIPQPIAPVDDLSLAWNTEYNYKGDARFMEYLLQQDKVNLPLLLCPDDCDFSCVVIIAEVEKTGSLVYWKRIGKVNHSIESFEEEKRHGIAFVDAYTDDDWKEYNDPELHDVDSDKWREWISANWSEELYRRRINYTYPCFQDNRNIDWIYACNWCFDRKEYEVLAASYHPTWWIGEK